MVSNEDEVLCAGCEAGDNVRLQYLCCFLYNDNLGLHHVKNMLILGSPCCCHANHMDSLQSIRVLFLIHVSISFAEIVKVVKLPRNIPGFQPFQPKSVEGPPYPLREVIDVSNLGSLCFSQWYTMHKFVLLLLVVFNRS